MADAPPVNFPGGAGGAPTSLVGIPKGYVPPSSPGYVPANAPITGEQSLAQMAAGPYTTQLTPPGPGQVQGSVTPFNQFGEPLTTPGYTEQDVWAPGNDPAYVPTLQARLVQAGLLKPYGFRPGIWDAPSAAAYRTLLAFANHSGSTDHQALNYMIANPSIPKSASTYKPVLSETIESTANLKAGLHNAALSLTGGDLPNSQVDQFLLQYREDEMRQAAAHAQAYDKRGTIIPAVTPTTPEAWIRQNDAALVQGFGTASRMLEFYKLMGVNI